jgi:hypothetical protein
MAMANTERGWRLEGLGATGPEPSLKEDLMLFGQFVGDWKIEESRTLEEDGRWSSQTGELHWRWVLDGRAVQDVWMYYDKDSSRLVPAGTTLRFYDSEKLAWRSIWITPRNHDVGLFLGKRVGDEIVLELQKESKHEGESDLRWIFYDITPNSFKWRAEESADDGKTWSMNHEMTIRRLGSGKVASGSER